MPRPSRMDDIIAASAKVFSSKGFDGARLDDIAREVGVWKGSIYHYIDTKDDLLFAVVREPAERILSETQALVKLDAPADEKIRRLCRMHVDVLVSTHPFAAVYVEEIAGKHRFPEWEAKDREYVSLVERIISDLIAEREEPLDAAVAARALIGSLNWMTRWYRAEGRMVPNDVADTIAELFLSGLGP